jgi:SAM-dependent methyltransferase
VPDRNQARDAFWEFERDGWHRAAPLYERSWNDTRLFVEPLLNAAAVGEGTRLLDVACGPGYVSEAAAARGARPVGLDVAPGMLERARARSPGMQFVEGDAHALPFAGASFEAVTMNFGILHLSRPDAAVAEGRRVLAPGGSYAFTAWVAEDNAQAEIVEAALSEHALPVDVPEGPGFYRFANPEVCRGALEAAGFDPGSIRSETIRTHWRVPSAEFLFEAELHAGVRMTAVLAAQPPERLAAIREAMVEGVRRYADGDAFALPIVARVASARAPGP